MGGSAVSAPPFRRSQGMHSSKGLPLGERRPAQGRRGSICTGSATGAPHDGCGVGRRGRAAAHAPLRGLRDRRPAAPGAGVAWAVAVIAHASGSGAGLVGGLGRGVVFGDQLGPHQMPVAPELSPCELLPRCALHADSVPRVHVTAPCQALVQVLVVDLEFGCDFAPLGGWNAHAAAL